VAAAPTATAAGAAAVTAACGMAALGLFAVLVATMVAHLPCELQWGPLPCSGVVLGVTMAAAEPAFVSCPTIT